MLRNLRRVRKFPGIFLLLVAIWGHIPLFYAYCGAFPPDFVQIAARESAQANACSYSPTCSSNLRLDPPLSNTDTEMYADDNRFGKTPPDNADGESSTQRLVWAMNTVQSQHECFERLLIDLKQSMDAVSLPRPMQIVSSADTLTSSSSNCGRLNKMNSR